MNSQLGRYCSELATQTVSGGAQLLFHLVCGAGVGGGGCFLCHAVGSAGDNAWHDLSDSGLGNSPHRHCGTPQLPFKAGHGTSVTPHSTVKSCFKGETRLIGLTQSQFFLDAGLLLPSRDTTNHQVENGWDCCLCAGGARKSGSLVSVI